MKHFTLQIHREERGLSRPFKTLVPADSWGEPEAQIAARIIHNETGEAMESISSCLAYIPPIPFDGKPRREGYKMTVGHQTFYLFSVWTQE